MAQVSILYFYKIYILMRKCVKNTILFFYNLIYLEKKLNKLYIDII